MAAILAVKEDIPGSFMSESDTGLVRVALEKLLEPINDLIQKLAGPAAEEIGLTLRDSVRVYRFRRQLRLFKRVQEMLADANVKPQPVEPRVLLPVADYASVESNDELQDKWAALLANAANPGGRPLLLPSFIETLKQLSPTEASMLDQAYDKDLKGALTYKEVADQRYYRLADRVKHGQVTLENLMRLGLIEQNAPDEIVAKDLDIFDVTYSLTPYGYSFVQACRAPRGETRDPAC
jgi:hypothetical protein